MGRKPQLGDKSSAELRSMRLKSKADEVRRVAGMQPLLVYDVYRIAIPNSGVKGQTVELAYGHRDDFGRGHRRDRSELRTLGAILAFVAQSLVEDVWNAALRGAYNEI
jgi:hypothetical protein